MYNQLELPQIAPHFLGSIYDRFESLPVIEISDHLESKPTDDEDIQCGICYNNKNNITLNKCKHKICSDCYKK